LLGFRRAAHQPAVIKAARRQRWLRFPLLVFATLIFLLLGYLLETTAFEPSPQFRLALDLVGGLILFPALALYLWGLVTLGKMFTASSGFGCACRKVAADHQRPYRYVRHQCIWR
jgi:hypothetical protein